MRWIRCRCCSCAPAATERDLSRIVTNQYPAGSCVWGSGTVVLFPQETLWGLPSTQGSPNLPHRPSSADLPGWPLKVKLNNTLFLLYPFTSLSTVQQVGTVSDYIAAFSSNLFCIRIYFLQCDSWPYLLLRYNATGSFTSSTCLRNSFPALSLSSFSLIRESGEAQECMWVSYTLHFVCCSSSSVMWLHSKCKYKLL